MSQAVGILSVPGIFQPHHYQDLPPDLDQMGLLRRRGHEQ